MKKTDTIAFYREAYLKGKTEEECRMFDEKGIDKQYGSIMAWKRRSQIAAKDKENKDACSLASIIGVLKKAKSDISLLERLSDNERNKLYEAINGVKDEVDNFDRNKIAKRLQELESKRDEINREGENLNRQIEELRLKLS